jgi:hypothetical protein
MTTNNVNLGTVHPETDLRFYDKVSSILANVRGNVQTEQVRDGYFWFIPFLHLTDSDTTNQLLALFLVNADSFALAPQSITNATPVPAPVGSILLAPTCPQTGGFAGNWQSQQNSPATPFWKSSGIVVPSRFSLMSVEYNSSPSTANRTMGIRFLYRQIPNDCMPLMFA